MPVKVPARSRPDVDRIATLGIGQAGQIEHGITRAPRPQYLEGRPDASAAYRINLAVVYVGADDMRPRGAQEKPVFRNRVDRPPDGYPLDTDTTGVLHRDSRMRTADVGVVGAVEE